MISYFFYPTEKPLAFHFTPDDLMTLRVYILARNLFATKGKISKSKSKQKSLSVKPNLALTNQYHGDNGGG